MLQSKNQTAIPAICLDRFFYSQSKNNDLFEANPEPGVSVITGIGGKGMTTTAGLAEARIRSMYSLASS